MKNRKCGECTLCCTLLPVLDGQIITSAFGRTVNMVKLDKKANQRCPHQCSKGCRIYDSRPGDCWAWSCRWLLGGDVGERPDRSHVIVDDMLLDAARVGNDEGWSQSVYAVQVWCDPKHRDAWNNPDVLRYLEAECEKRQAIVIVRYSSAEAFALVPPHMSGGRGWVQKESSLREENDPRVAEDRKRLGLPHVPSRRSA